MCVKRVHNYQLIWSVASNAGWFPSLCKHWQVCDKWEKIQIIKWHIGVQQYKPCPVLYCFSWVQLCVIPPQTQPPPCPVPAPPDVAEKVQALLCLNSWPQIRGGARVPIKYTFSISSPFLTLLVTMLPNWIKGSNGNCHKFSPLPSSLPSYTFLLLLWFQGQLLLLNSHNHYHNRLSPHPPKKKSCALWHTSPLSATHLTPASCNHFLWSIFNPMLESDKLLTLPCELPISLYLTSALLLFKSSGTSSFFQPLNLECPKVQFWTPALSAVTPHLI